MSSDGHQPAAKLVGDVVRIGVLSKSKSNDSAADLAEAFLPLSTLATSSPTCPIVSSTQWVPLYGKPKLCRRGSGG
jgi:hypothetical protein